jgi:cardiolipin synthase
VRRRAAADEPVPGHSAQVLLDGREAYPAMLRAIDAAERTCWLETYILSDDRVGRTFARAIAARAREGVASAVIYDAFGSYGLSDTYIGVLRDAGVAVAAYHGSHLRFWEWNRRDHRKTLVVDGRVGFLGGINIGDDYAPPEQGGGGWRDTHLRLEGPEVATLVALFCATWRYLEGTPPPGAPRCSSPPAPLPDGPTLARVVGARRLGERLRIKHASRTCARSRARRAASRSRTRTSSPTARSGASWPPRCAAASTCA